ncbi:helix-turn-helix domain-containing protein [Bifidobacterium pseudolongum]|uniref:Uncharacterized protein n=1 Tax=Bifidobacterium pseudolongum subsp. globosum TaxID=1690 RepID=A0A2N3QR03_9BIFI|nr:hypothetical protein [Bifidobacterium pseudolongum]MCH4835650.1 hypothetical protein [Bifidobacterium pseudolongum]MCH4860592.1 hypothetical protein [Bifidobacterium pseudolongum]MCH4862363.1 hypothetical protein [Bifidobacterium pseudolongum]PKU94201.1 hypothetical protein CQR45_1358 [Bifidobacterium pseudolongum subsp. globosum]RYQ48741.1 hypothetical protein PG1770B_1303 [Bifidobacterium pseudolongum subsp. globosum]
MPTHKSAHQKAMIRIGDALTHLYNAVTTSADAYTRADAMLVRTILTRTDWRAVLDEAARHTGRDGSQLEELDLFIADDLQHARFDPFEWLGDDERRLTPAEFHCLRQQLGVTTKWLASRWNVTERSVQRWENFRCLPLEFTEDVLALRTRQLDLIHTQCEEAMRAQSGVMVPRKNIMPAEYPAEWWQIIAWHVHEKTGATILYTDDATEEFEEKPCHSMTWD